MFDLPVKTKKQRSEATRFRNMLLDNGFAMAQLSVYVQYLPLAAGGAKLAALTQSEGASGGGGRVLAVSDNQWSKMIRFSNMQAEEPEPEPAQLMIF